MTGGVIDGAEYMAAFGLGTVPMMLAISLSGKLVPITLRLKLRTRKLNAIADSALETGEIDFARLNKEERLAMTSYMLLASLQEIVIRHLDPSGE